MIMMVSFASLVVTGSYLHMFSKAILFRVTCRPTNGAQVSQLLELCLQDVV